MDLPWILLFISIILIAIIAWHGSKFSPVDFFQNLFKKKPAAFFDEYDDEYQEAVQNDLFENNPSADSHPTTPAPENQVFCINLKAPEGRSFAGEQLVVQLNRAGLRYGNYDIFHYDEIFSMASAYEPGTFNLDRLDELQTPALTFFMETAHQSDIMDAFETMLDTVQNLADQLRAEICDDTWEPLDEIALEKYYDKIDQLERA